METVVPSTVPDNGARPFAGIERHLEEDIGKVKDEGDHLALYTVRLAELEDLQRVPGQVQSFW